MPNALPGTGEARRAVASARGTELATESARCRPDVGEDDITPKLELLLAAGEVIVKAWRTSSTRSCAYRHERNGWRRTG